MCKGEVAYLQSTFADCQFPISGEALRESDEEVLVPEEKTVVSLKKPMENEKVSTQPSTQPTTLPPNSGTNADILVGPPVDGCTCAVTCLLTPHSYR